MRPFSKYVFPCLALVFLGKLEAAQENSPEKAPAELQGKIEKVTVEQDELQADVQELVAEQTDQEVVQLLEECQGFMNEAIDGLENYDTSGKTIAAQTDVIEKFFEAAKKKASKSGNGGMNGMLQMMQGMMGQMGQDPSGKDGDEKEGEGNSTPGKGGNGEGDAKDSPSTGSYTEKKGPRRLSKAGGKGDIPFPKEFSKALDAYNKSLEKTEPSKP